MKLTLAGAAITAMFSSFTQGLLVLNEAALEQVLFWLAGSVQGRSLAILSGVFPYIVAGWIIALFIAGKMNILAMGEDVAKGLGLKTTLIKFLALDSCRSLGGWFRRRCRSHRFHRDCHPAFSKENHRGRP